MMFTHTKIIYNPPLCVWSYLQKLPHLLIKRFMQRRRRDIVLVMGPRRRQQEKYSFAPRILDVIHAFDSHSFLTQF